ncbi:PhzF family phenazine biosynthesis protein [Pontibacter silvestris]|uniref:PhzF family phenazine biosynthesis protein n=1 Tax=Pontibacter silvestris TaxID=2305183 RepID=A0ABW4WRY5_9BACT|nr:PhzF family phenazine biosynthesis protein [Pontibacter silvestris]MCC9136180.1 PhzF family phenazine biosynthesis protein [Pontibacter silvestris]
MPKIKLYQIDAFTDKVFRGNPAAVCVLDEWLEDEKMQNIAAENNLAETAFLVKRENDYEIRWFTPLVEVDLCGHATLASAYVLFNFYNHATDRLNLYSHRSGMLSVEKTGEELTLNFPIDVIEKAEAPKALVEALGNTPTATYKGKTDYLLVFASQQDIEAMKPDLRLLATVEARGIIVSAPGDEVDFVSRFFAPQVGVDEDPVTGSAHTTLIPYWSDKLRKKSLTAKQLSKRHGDLKCELLGDRVNISGKAVAYLTGEIDV